MKPTQSTAVKIFGALCLSVTIAPSMTMAQARAGRGDAPGAGGMAQQVQQVLKDLDLTPDEKSKIDPILKQSQSDAREALQGMADATPEEKMQKMQDVQKIMSDTKEKVAAELTPEQKAKFYGMTSKLMVKRAADRFTAEKAGAEKMTLTDDQKDQLKPVFADAAKAFDGYKTDAETVKDSQTADDLQEKVTATMRQTNEDMAKILGREDMQKLMRSTMGGAAGGRAGNRRGGNDGAEPKDAPTTAPN